MELIVDLHIHSRFARATSRELTLPNVYKWAKIKGINVVATGDFTHPAQFSEVNKYLENAEDGLFKLKEQYAKAIDALLPESVSKNLVRFILCTEVSSMYSRGGKHRGVHNLIALRSIESAKSFSQALSKFGNLASDGRPTVGLDSEGVLKMAFEADTHAMFIPAHIWTPWYSVFGSKSGFDSLEEAFGEGKEYITGVETGLSSDPFMNWRVGELDGIAIVSGSDAHSLPKLAREATILDTSLSYLSIRKAIKDYGEEFIGTFEFFPEEGKYHHDGHAACKVRFTPEQTKRTKGRCPNCGGLLTKGVLHRVEDLSTRPVSFRPKKHKEVISAVPVVEIIAEILRVKNIGAKKVKEEYERVYSTLGGDFHIFRHVAVEEIKRAGFPELSDAVDRMRKGNIFIDPGYDGVYGTVKIFKDCPNQNQLALI